MTPFDLAQRLVGEILERPGAADHPFILWCLESCNLGGDLHDEIPWCSAFVNRICWLRRLPRSKSAAARSWLAVGKAVHVDDAEVGFDVVVLQRGSAPQPGPEVIAATGHVGFYAGRDGDKVLVLGGNQGNGVTVAQFDIGKILGIRRLV